MLTTFIVYSTVPSESSSEQWLTSSEDPISQLFPLNDKKNKLFPGKGYIAKVLQSGALDTQVVDGLVEPGPGVRLELDPPDQRESVQQSGRPDIGHQESKLPE